MKRFKMISPKNLVKLGTLKIYLESRMILTPSQLNNKYVRTERESRDSEISFNSEISAIAWSTYRKSIYNE